MRIFGIGGEEDAREVELACDPKMNLSMKSSPLWRRCCSVLQEEVGFGPYYAYNSLSPPWDSSYHFQFTTILISFAKEIWQRMWMKFLVKMDAPTPTPQHGVMARLPEIEMPNLPADFVHPIQRLEKAKVSAKHKKSTQKESQRDPLLNQVVSSGTRRALYDDGVTNLDLEDRQVAVECHSINGRDGSCKTQDVMAITIAENDLYKQAISSSKRGRRGRLIGSDDLEQNFSLTHDEDSKSSAEDFVAGQFSQPSVTTNPVNWDVSRILPPTLMQVSNEYTQIEPLYSDDYPAAMVTVSSASSVAPTMPDTGSLSVKVMNVSNEYNQLDPSPYLYSDVNLSGTVTVSRAPLVEPITQDAGTLVTLKGMDIRNELTQPDPSLRLYSDDNPSAMVTVSCASLVEPEIQFAETSETVNAMDVNIEFTQSDSDPKPSATVAVGRAFSIEPTMEDVEPVTVEVTEVANEFTLSDPSLYLNSDPKPSATVAVSRASLVEPTMEDVESVTVEVMEVGNEVTQSDPKPSATVTVSRASSVEPTMDDVESVDVEVMEVGNEVTQSDPKPSATVAVNRASSVEPTMEDVESVTVEVIEVVNEFTQSDAKPSATVAVSRASSAEPTMEDVESVTVEVMEVGNEYLDSDPKPSATETVSRASSVELTIQDVGSVFEEPMEGSNECTQSDPSLYLDSDLKTTETVGLASSVEPTMQDLEPVTVKVEYDGKMIKFKLSTSSELTEFEEEVAKRLKLEIGSFNLEYVDEDDDRISLTCSEDLWCCVGTWRSLGGSTSIRMLVHLTESE